MGSAGGVKSIKPEPSQDKRKDFHVRLSTSEKSVLDEAAKREGFTSAGAFMRYHALAAARDRIPPNQYYPLLMEKK